MARMPVYVLESVDERVHLIAEMTKEKKKGRIVITKCGLTLSADSAFYTGWDQDITCPKCASPWV